MRRALQTAITGAGCESLSAPLTQICGDPSRHRGALVCAAEMPTSYRFLHHLSCAVTATWALTVCACGGSPNAPGQARTTTTTTIPTNTWSVAGQVVATGSQQGVGGATITPGWSLSAVNADEQGTFALADRTNPPSMPAPVTISQPGFISHDVWLAWQVGARENVALDIIRDAPPFSKDFYTQFVRDSYDRPSGPPSFLRRWEMAPSFYVRTVDQNGRPVEPEVLAVTLDALRRAVPAYTANRYAAAAIETGTDVRPTATGWINVDFRRESSSKICGQSFVGANPGTITLFEDICSCGSIKVPGSVTMHEVGHALGFFHVGDKDSLMYPFDSGFCRAGALSAAESFHAAIAYSRPRQNTDPDKDPSSFRTLGAPAEGPLVER